MLVLGRREVFGICGVGYSLRPEPTGTLRCSKDQEPREGLSREPLAKGNLERDWEAALLEGRQGPGC